MTGRDGIAILDFGSQYTQLIARRIRERQVYCEILPHDTPADALRALAPRGILLSGGPASVLDEGAPEGDPRLFELGLPVLGICYGMQWMARVLGGTVRAGKGREYGSALIRVPAPEGLFLAMPDTLSVWMSHGDQVGTPPPGFLVRAGTPDCPVAAMEHPGRRWFGLQFHPEVVHTPRGAELLERFVFDACGCPPDWKMSSFVEESVARIREEVGGGQVLLGLSGGVDSSVTAALLHRAVGRRLHCVFVDNGVLRFMETEQVEDMFARAFGMDLRVVRAGPRFLAALRGVTDPEAKRKIIGSTFIEVFAAEARALGKVEFLAQGTLYPDVIESRSANGGPSATIKSHHNVGGLPPDLSFRLIEPLRDLFKDEVRALGRELGLPDHLVDRQPFPGPGLAVRILGEVTAGRVAILQQADLRVQEEILRMPNARDVWQAFAVLLPVRTVGVMGDERTYENVCAVRCVQSLDGMTADWFRLPHERLDAIARRIINEVPGINRVVYDISSKPPGTIEWE